MQILLLLMRARHLPPPPPPPSFAPLQTPPPPSFLTEPSKAAHLLQVLFVCVSLVSYVTFVLSFFVPHLVSFGASGGLCFVIEAFPRYLYLYYFHKCFLVRNISPVKKFFWQRFMSVSPPKYNYLTVWKGYKMCFGIWGYLEGLQ